MPRSTLIGLRGVQRLRPESRRVDGARIGDRGVRSTGEGRGTHKLAAGGVGGGTGPSRACIGDLTLGVLSPAQAAVGAVVGDCWAYLGEIGGRRNDG